MLKKGLVCAVVAAVIAFAAQVSSSAQDSGKFDALKRFSQVLDIVSQYYVRDISTSELIDGALKGMLQSLDAHSTMMTPKEFQELQQATSGQFFGIGIEITQENNQLIVVTPIDDTPAFKAGLKPGDVILKIDNESTHGMSLNDAVSHIRGRKGEPVSLTVLHKGALKPFEARMKRDAIPLRSVKSRQLEPGYHWVRISHFSEKTTDELKVALQAARHESPSGKLKGVVLDLRYNPGGLLDAAIGVSDMFLGSGTIVSVRGRKSEEARKYAANSQPSDVSAPMVVLVNGGSASASEIVAAALSDNRRALIVGEPSFGKGSVQSLVPMSDGGGLKLTIAMYYTPSGRSIQAEGVQPDVLIPFELPRTDEKADSLSRLAVREKDLSNHLFKPDGEAPGVKTEKNENGGEKWLEQDNQLRMSLQLVKTLPKFAVLK